MTNINTGEFSIPAVLCSSSQFDTMWSRVVTVVIVSSLVSSVISLTDLEDNIVPDNSLQELIQRTKKSPVEVNTKTPTKPESKSDSELKAVLTEDIKRKIDDLKELKNAYHKVEADFFGSETLKSVVENGSLEVLSPESKNSSQGSDDESVRNARQYFPPSYLSDKQYQSYDSQKGMFPVNSYSNRKYQSVSSQSMDSFGNRDAPYIAQYNPSARTFGADGTLKFLADLQDAHKVADVKPEVAIHTPVVSIKPVELPHPEIPPPVNIVLPASLPTVTISEHKPHETKKHDSKVPLYYEKKEIGTPESFFSKQVIYGPNYGFDEGHSYSPYTSYSSYPQGYGSGSPSYWYATDRDGYSSYPTAQNNYNYGPVYSPGYPYQQSSAYYPASGTYRSNKDFSDSFQKYQDELDSLLSQFFRADLAAEANFGNYSSVDRLKEDIEKEQKKIQTLQEELKIPQGSNEGVSQSFINWMSKEIDAVYSRWTHLKDDISKAKPDSGVSAKEDIKVDNVKV